LLVSQKSDCCRTRTISSAPRQLHSIFKELRCYAHAPWAGRCLMPVRRYESCPVANRLGHALQSWRRPESDRRVVIVAAGRGQSRALYFLLRDLQSTGRLGMNTMGTQLFVGERFSSKGAQYITQMHWLLGIYHI